MPQKLYEDKIGSLSHATGTISLGTSRLTIGGQQYAGVPTALTVGTVTANTLYMIYAVRSGGNTILVKSVNVNSVGPATYTSWKLVGAFMANMASTPVFGSFVTIEGIPTGDLIIDTNYGPKKITGADITGITYDAGTKVLGYRRLGDSIDMLYTFITGITGTVGVTTDEWSLYFTNLTFDGTNFPFVGSYSGKMERYTGGANNKARGVGLTFNDVVQIAGYVQFSFTDRDNNSGSVNSTNIATVLGSATRIFLYMKANLPVKNWSNTPLKDL